MSNLLEAAKKVARKKQKQWVKDLYKLNWNWPKDTRADRRVPAFGRRPRVVKEEWQQILETRPGLKNSSYHSVFIKAEKGANAGKWHHVADLDNHEDAKDEMRYIRDQGEKPLRLIVPKKDAQWHKGLSYIHNYVERRLKQNLNLSNRNITVKEELDEGRITKAGLIKNHPWIEKQVKTLQGKTGIVKGVERVHTFSRMVPFKTILHITHGDGTTSYDTRKDHARLVKKQSTEGGEELTRWGGVQRDEAILDLGGLNMGYRDSRMKRIDDTKSTARNAQKARNALIALHRNNQAITAKGMTPTAKALAKIIRHHFKGGKNVVDTDPPNRHQRVPGEHEFDESQLK